VVILKNLLQNNERDEYSKTNGHAINQGHYYTDLNQNQAKTRAVRAKMRAWLHVSSATDDITVQRDPEPMKAQKTRI
jgi:hypothetical protein